MKRIGIAGAGLMGRMLGFACLNAGFHVTLIDRDPINSKASCGFAGAGLLAPWCEAEKYDQAHFEMACASLNLWPDWVRSIGIPIFFQQTGSVFVSHQQDWPELERITQALAQKLGSRWVPQWRTGSSWQALEPECAKKFDRALYFPEEGQVEAWDLMPALAKILNEKATWIAKRPILAIAPGLIYTERKSFKFDHVVDCRGLGAAPDLPHLRGVRGELVALHAPEVRLNRPLRLAHPRFPLYIAPRPDHIFLVGASQLESESMAPIALRSALELLSAAYSIHPGFAESHIVNSSVHCRPAFADNRPKIFSQPGLTRINGLYRHGFLLSPLLAQETVRILNGQGMMFPELLIKEECCEGNEPGKMYPNLPVSNPSPT